MAFTRAASIMFQQHMVAIMNDVEELMKENKMLDKKFERLVKKKEENLVKICGIIANTKKMRFEDNEANDYEVRDDGTMEVVIEAIEDEGRDVESLEEGVMRVREQLRELYKGHREGNNVGVEDLKREEKVLLEKIKESTKNLGDHKKMLVSMEKENGKDDNWHAQLNDVKKFTVIHKKYKEVKERRIDAIRKEVKRHESLKKKGTKDKFVTNPEASTSSGVGSSTSRLDRVRFAVKRKLNESVLDCGEIVKKIPTKEKEAMVPIVLKVEESPCEYPHECSFAECRRVLTNAASLATHLGKHYATNQAKIDCPFPSCQFTNTQEHLTKHMRSKHTKEQIFTCDHCSTKFHTMDAKVAHERKHGQQDIWGQCDKEDCLRFFQLTKGHRSCSKD